MNATTIANVSATRSSRLTCLRRPVAVSAALAVALGGAVGLASAATAADPAPSFTVYDEKDSPNPYDVVGGLVFYEGADLGWFVNTPMTDVEDLSYTVAEGTSYAPSFQLIAKTDKLSYARLVWEPYMQKQGLNEKSGAYTDLQDGLWWTNKIASGPGSQSAPQPLEFFEDGGDAGWNDVMVGAIDVHQGGSTKATHVVTDVAFNGHSVSLGTADTTPFDQAYVNAATAPLNSKVKSLTSTNADLTAQVKALKAQVASLDAYKATHTYSDSAYKAAADKVKAYQAKGEFSISGTMKVGKKLTVSGTKVSGVSYSYQWFVGGKAVSKATASTYTLGKSAAGHSVAVKVTRTYKDSNGKSQSVTITSRVEGKVLVAK